MFLGWIIPYLALAVDMKKKIARGDRNGTEVLWKRWLLGFLCLCCLRVCA